VGGANEQLVCCPSSHRGKTNKMMILENEPNALKRKGCLLQVYQDLGCVNGRDRHRGKPWHQLALNPQLGRHTACRQSTAFLKPPNNELVGVHEPTKDSLHHKDATPTPLCVAWALTARPHLGWHDLTWLGLGATTRGRNDQEIQLPLECYVQHMILPSFPTHTYKTTGPSTSPCTQMES
jgi:hypothetical protein